MTELSHFEAESAKTPVKEPYAILIGTVLLIIILYLLNQLSPNEAIQESRQAEDALGASPAAATPSADDDEI